MKRWRIRMRPKGSQVMAEFINCSNRKLLDDPKAIEKALSEGGKKAGLHITDIRGRKFDPIGATVVAVVTESHIGIHTFPEANHASIDIYTCTPDFDGPLKLLDYLKKRFRPKTSRSMQVVRGSTLNTNEKEWVVAFSSYGFETRYHVKKKVFLKDSEYQKIEIIDNEEFGRMLFLDNDLQVAESDENLFNEMMMSPLSGLKGSAKPAKIAVLGGGDGGLLRHALDLKPKEAVLVEIDKEVVEASRKYLDSISRGAFDHPKTNIIIDDAKEYMRNQKDEFDAVIYDLTMHPEALTTEERKKYLNRIFSAIRAGMKKGATITMHCCGEYDTETLKILKSILPKHFKDIKFRTGFIPSFCERWVFASGKKR
ncbi:MAG: adenosylmethionine decarboxylase [Candidatus Woesearchaeota archaeon]